MKFEIKHKLTEEILFSGDYKSLKIALESAVKNGANLIGANLIGANLVGANLDGANLVGANLRGANLDGANLVGANLDGANLRGANLDRANLRGANLVGVKEYKNDHDIFIEAIRRQQVKIFTSTEWQIIGEVTIHRICWDAIKKRFGKKIIPVFKKLAKAGFKEWLEYYMEFVKGE